MALSAARHVIYERTRVGDLLRIPLAADAICYVGGGACVDADGYGVPAADTANYKSAGIVVEDPMNPGVSVFDNTGGDDGDMEVLVRVAGRFRLPLHGRTPSQDMLLAKVYWYDDQYVAVHRFDVTNDIRCGHIVRLPASTLALHPDTEFGTDEVEVELSGEPFDWDGSVTTSTTTTAQA